MREPSLARALLLGALVPLAGGSAPGDAPVAQGPRVEARMVLHAQTSDPVFIERVLSQQVLGWDPQATQSLEIVDLGEDGFGEGDLLRALPGGQSHLLTPLDRELRETLGSWAFAANHEIHAPLSVEPEELRQSSQPTAALLADVLGAARRHLGLARFELALDAREDGLLLRVWDYPGDSLYARPGTEGGRRVLDVVQIMREDTTYVVDKVLRDLLILESQVVDTVYLRKPDRP
jgi:hypothetical protein